MLEEKLHAVEEKWISNQIGRDTYERWSSTYNTEIFTIKAYIERYTRDQNQGYKILKKYLHHLGDMKFVYNQSDTIEKRALVSKVFDSNLYYENGVYRTPTIVPVLACNELIMKEKGLLEIDKKRDFPEKIPSSGAGGIRTLVQTWYKVSFLHA